MCVWLCACRQSKCGLGGWIACDCSERRQRRLAELHSKTTSKPAEKKVHKSRCCRPSMFNVLSSVCYQYRRMHVCACYAFLQTNCPFITRHERVRAFSTQSQIDIPFSNPIVTQLGAAQAFCVQSWYAYANRLSHHVCVCVCGGCWPPGWLTSLIKLINK